MNYAQIKCMYLAAKSKHAKPLYYDPRVSLTHSKMDLFVIER